MSRLFNVRPIDPAWCRLAEETAQEAADKLASLVVMIVAQEGGKIGITIGGKPLGPETTALEKLFRDDPGAFFFALAELAELIQQSEKRETRQ